MQLCVCLATIGGDTRKPGRAEFGGARQPVATQAQRAEEVFGGGAVSVRGERERGAQQGERGGRTLTPVFACKPRHSQ